MMAYLVKVLARQVWDLDIPEPRGKKKSDMVACAHNLSANVTQMGACQPA